MQISATVRNAATSHDVSVSTSDSSRRLAVPPKAEGGRGSAVSGGEFLMLALATCYCNDLFREAGRLNIVLDAVEVEASAEFEGTGLAATNIVYRARVASPAPEAQIEALLSETDAVAEVQNTLRAGADVVRRSWPG